MSNQFGHDDEDASPMADAVSGRNRRSLLSAAAGGLALAASGLFLPEWLVETEAREGANGGTLGGRRGKSERGRNDQQRRRRERDRRQDKKKDEDKPRGNTVYDIEIVVHNGRSVPVQVQGWDALPSFTPPLFHIPSGWDWSTIPAKADGSEAATKLFTGNGRTAGEGSAYVVVRIGTDRLVTVWNRGWVPQLGQMINADVPAPADGTAVAGTRRERPSCQPSTFPSIRGPRPRRTASRSRASTTWTKHASGSRSS